MPTSKSIEDPLSDIMITVLHGADRGRVSANLAPPITIGREEGNTVQLNDERVSRCHLKIQKDKDRLVLTDLQSTNGTKVNGTECQLRILRQGDLISVGRSLLLVGNEEQINRRLAMLSSRSDDGDISRDFTAPDASMMADLNSDVKTPSPIPGLMGFLEPPSIPDGLSAGQKAQLCEILDYLHSKINDLVQGARVDESSQEVYLDFKSWQKLLDSQARLVRMVRKVADPDYDEHA